MKKLNKEQKKILKIIREEWKYRPHLRFGQLLTCLNVNQFANEKNPESEKHQLRDIFNDADSKILKRIENSPLLEPFDEN